MADRMPDEAQGPIDSTSARIVQIKRPTLPDPLVSPEVDLRGYEFMPFYGDRLFGSETWIAAPAEAKTAALKLWWRAYAKEVPAASLPSNDTLLAEYAGYGVSVRAWQRIKRHALRGFIECSDGRLYHPHLAVWAMEAWAKRLKDRKRKADWRNRHRDCDGDGTGPATGTAFVTERGQHNSGTADRTGDDRTGTGENVFEIQEVASQPLSGLPPDDELGQALPKGHQEGRGGSKSSDGRALAKAAREVLAFLNEKARKKFPPNANNVGIIVARLREGFTPAQARMVVAMKVRKWFADDVMREYLRPDTLFNPKKFSNYVGELVDIPDDAQPEGVAP